MQRPIQPALLLVFFLVVSSPLLCQDSGQWTLTGRLNTPRTGQAATLLADGRVLVAGGLHAGSALASAELYDPRSGMWTRTGDLQVGRAATSAVLLPDGRVLIAGGCTGSCDTPTASVEIYDPASATWSETGPLNTPRYFHSTTVLPNGLVLVAGGCDGPACAHRTTSAELYDPNAGTWTPAGSLHDARSQQSATLLASGKVLVAGGQGATKVLASSEIYNPATGKWAVAGNLQMARFRHTATLTADGKVLAGGGRGGPFGAILCSAELFDPATATWTLTTTMRKMVENHTAVRLQNGQILAAGGDAVRVVNGQLVKIIRSQSKLYDLATSKWTLSGALNRARTGHTATLLPDGRVLVVGGSNHRGELASAELYAP